MKAEIDQVKSEFNSVKSGNRNVNQQMEIISSVLPVMQGSLERSQVQTMQEMQSLGKRLGKLETQIKSDRENKAQHQQAALDAIKQEVSANLQN